MATKREAEARREAVEAERRNAEEAKKQREAQEEERRRNAEKRKQVEFDRYQNQLEIDRQRQQQAAQQKQITQKQEEQSPSRPSGPRPTFSLFGFGGPKEESTTPKTAVAAPPAKLTITTAPRGVPTINKWKLNSDNTISGFISGSSNFNDGEPVTTSPITGSATSGTVVQTKSRSNYFLGEPASSGGVFGFFGGQDVSSPKATPAAAATAQSSTDAAEARKRAAEAAKEAQQKAQAQAKKVAEEKRRIAEEGKWLSQCQHFSTADGYTKSYCLMRIGQSYCKTRSTDSSK